MSFGRDAVIVRKLSWQVLVFCVACGKLAGFDDLQGPEGSDAESGAAGESESGGVAGNAGSAGASAGSTGATGSGSGGKGSGGSAGGGAVGGSSAGEGGAGDVPGVGGSGANAGAGASGGLAGAGGGGASGVGGSAGTSETGGASGASAGSSGTTGGGGAGGAGTSGTGGTAGGGAGGGAGIGNPSGCGELLTNGGFEQDRLGWDVMTSYANLELNVHEAIVDRDDDALAAIGVTPYAGDFLAWAGGIPDSNRNHSLFVTQPIVISENVTELIFSGQFSIESDEPIDEFYDALYVEVLDLDYQRVWQFGAFSNQHAGPWFAIDPIEPDSGALDLMRGGQLHMGIYSRTDSNTVTHFFFDELSLVAVCD
jgi:hypothetical protein